MHTMQKEYASKAFAQLTINPNEIVKDATDRNLIFATRNRLTAQKNIKA